MASNAINVQLIEKLFPPAQSGWKAFLAPFARPIHPALTNVSFTIDEGESVAILGANGAGKSTLLRILTTLLLPSGGSASVAGFDVVRDPVRVRRALGFHSGAEPGFYARLTALQNLKFFASFRNLSPREAAPRISQMADRLGLTSALNQQVRTLSTGTVQRLSLVRALLHSPSVLLLDEPTRSLDPLAAADFRRFLRQDWISRQGATLLFASHTLAEVEELADRIVFLDDGKLLFYGTPSEMKRHSAAGTLEGAMEILTRSRVKSSGNESHANHL